MNKAHRDRIAFMRTARGSLPPAWEVVHVQGGNKKIKLSQPQLYDGAGAPYRLRRITLAILSACSIWVFFLLEIHDHGKAVSV